MSADGEVLGRPCPSGNGSRKGAQQNEAEEEAKNGGIDGSFGESVDFAVCEGDGRGDSGGFIMTESDGWATAIKVIKRKVHGAMGSQGCHQDV
jgi:hypothetical protein